MKFSNNQRKEKTKLSSKETGAADLDSEKVRIVLHRLLAL